jgi:hypothetical protein
MSAVEPNSVPSTDCLKACMNRAIWTLAAFLKRRLGYGVPAHVSGLCPRRERFTHRLGRLRTIEAVGRRQSRHDKPQSLVVLARRRSGRRGREWTHLAAARCEAGVRPRRPAAFYRRPPRVPLPPTHRLSPHGVQGGSVPTRSDVPPSPDADGSAFVQEKDSSPWFTSVRASIGGAANRI